MDKNEGVAGLHYYPLLAKGAKAARPRLATSETLALYVHIPFCDKRCYFCEFAVVAGKSVTASLVDDYLDALREEMRSFLEAAEHQPKIDVIQFGGGTPTSLSARALGKLLAFIFDEFDCSGLKEIVVEGFPNSITEDRIAVLEEVPNLKLNIGVQSFHPECLNSVGREHGAMAEAAISRAVASKIGSVGVDLIFGLPFSTPETVRSDIEKACALGAEHCALYPLWIYEQTALESQVRSGKVALPDRDVQQEQLFDGGAALASLGHSRYTAFHYSRSEGARHRYGLWQMLGRDWVGFGMSAMSHLNGDIFFNDRNIRSYIDKIKAGVTATMESSRLSAAEHMAFVFLYGLRLEKYSTWLFSDRFGVTVDDIFGVKLRHLEERGLLTLADGTIALTLPGIMALSAIENYVNDLCGLPDVQDCVVLTGHADAVPPRPVSVLH
ncbi:MAG TPA: coproporphyrinogen-III oxidase family protein [Vicinamibacterales bacterium]|nr:coproporphyrinogen-III oxidase family protein [Vicinamibacterales bacterium]